MSIEEEARVATVDQDARGYSPDKQYFARVASIWSIILRHEVTPAQVCLMMTGLKLVRLANNPRHHDSLVDLIGYAMCLEREVTDA